VEVTVSRTSRAQDYRRTVSFDRPIAASTSSASLTTACSVFMMRRAVDSSSARIRRRSAARPSGSLAIAGRPCPPSRRSATFAVPSHAERARTWTPAAVSARRRGPRPASRCSPDRPALLLLRPIPATRPMAVPDAALTRSLRVAPRAVARSSARPKRPWITHGSPRGCCPSWCGGEPAVGVDRDATRGPRRPRGERKFAHSAPDPFPCESMNYGISWLFDGRAPVDRAAPTR
jgi:hypothetical protein